MENMAFSCDGRSVQVNLDDKTKTHIQAMVAHQNRPAEWLKQVSRQHFVADQTRDEDMERLADMKAHGRIDHDAMMVWLDDLASFKTR